MTDIHILDEFTRSVTRTYPTEIPDVELSSTGGLQLHFGVPIETVANSWEGALIEFLTGACQGLSYVIGESNIQSVILTSPFFNRKPAAGDSVRIYGGPLSEVTIYNEDPETIKLAIEGGATFIMTASVLAGATVWKGLGGRSHKGIEATSRVFGIEVSVETKNITGVPTEDDMYRQFVALPLLKEQLLFLIQSFRVDAQNRLSGEGNIEWTKGYMQRAGGPVMRSYVINFDVVLN